MSLRFRGGGVAAVPPPPAEVFGPIGGVQPIKDGTNPHTVTSPGGGVTFTSASNIQTLMNTNPSNTQFVASGTGTYNNFHSLNYGAKHPRFYFPGAAASYQIRGLGTGGTGTEIGLDGSAGLEVYGGTWTNYATAAGAEYSTPINAVGNTIVEDAVFTLNAQKGFGISDVAGSTYRLTRCTFSSNGVYGLAGNGGGVPVPDITVEYCLVTDNNTSNFDCGIGCVNKFASGVTGTYAYNWFHTNNSGSGGDLWFDGDNYSEYIHDNVFEHNDGIFYEIGWGGTVIEHNYFHSAVPGTDANYPFNQTHLIISNAPCDASDGGPNVASEIRYNDFYTPTGYYTPIVLYDHGGQPVSSQCRNWNVHHNRMTILTTTGKCRLGLADACSVASGANGPAKKGKIGIRSDLLFDYNEYHIAGYDSSYQAWEHDTDVLSPGPLTWSLWQARGHDAHGTVVAI